MLTNEVRFGTLEAWIGSALVGYQVGGQQSKAMLYRDKRYDCMLDELIGSCNKHRACSRVQSTIQSISLSGELPFVHDDLPHRNKDEMHSKRGNINLSSLIVQSIKGRLEMSDLVVTFHLSRRWSFAFTSCLTLKAA